MLKCFFGNWYYKRYIYDGRAFLNQFFGVIMKIFQHQRFFFSTFIFSIAIGLIVTNLKIQACQQECSEQLIIEEIKSRYGITNAQDSCVTVNKTMQSHARMDPNYQIACVLAGYKQIYLGSSLQLEVAIMDPLIQKIVLPLSSERFSYMFVPDPLIFSKNNQQERMLVYDKLNPLPAFRFKKYCWQEVGRKKCSVEQGKHVLMGMLLGYSNQDIEYFYKRIGFFRHYPDYKRILLERDIYLYYDSWPTDIKRDFDIFESEWHGAIDYQRYEQDKKEALQWLSENNDLERVKRDIEQLKRQFFFPES